MRKKGGTKNNINKGYLPETWRRWGGKKSTESFDTLKKNKIGEALYLLGKKTQRNTLPDWGSEAGKRGGKSEPYYQPWWDGK